MNKENSITKVAISIDIDTLARDLFAFRSNHHSSLSIQRSLECCLPKILEYFSQRGIRATFFVVAEDAKSNPLWVRRIIEAGHEIASHSLSHPKQLCALSPDELKKEIVASKAILEDLTQRPVKGFRAPGYRLSHSIFDALETAGYLYDASLNLSFPYNALKIVARWLLISKRNRDYISPEPLRFRRLPAVYFPLRKDYTSLVSKDNQQETYKVLEIPIALLRWIHWPLATSLLQKFGARFAKQLIRLEKSHSQIIPIELHDFEFASFEDYRQVHGTMPRTNLMRYIGVKSDEGGINVISAVIDAVCENKDFRFSLLRDIAQEHLGDFK